MMVLLFRRAWGFVRVCRKDYLKDFTMLNEPSDSGAGKPQERAISKRSGCCDAL